MSCWFLYKKTIFYKLPRYLHEEKYLCGSTGTVFCDNHYASAQRLTMD